MTQDTAFGKAAVTAHIEVKKADGRVIYYEVRDGQNVEITEEQYRKATGKAG